VATFPNEQAALKALYLVAITKRPSRENLTRGSQQLEAGPQCLTIYYSDRFASAQ
jgi:hypothetical protein